MKISFSEVKKKTKKIVIYALFFVNLGAISTVAQENESNPPLWPESSVLIFDSNDEKMSEKIILRTKHLTDRHTGHFSKDRVVILLKPGLYLNQEINVGYYTQVLGLGEVPAAVTFATARGRGVYSDAMDQRPGGAGSLDTFWRSAENFRQIGDLKWAVSQAAPLRRIMVSNDLILHDNGLYASGGFMANILINGHVLMGSQQQWVTRNSQMASTPSEIMRGAWSLVFIGTRGNPQNTNQAKNTDTHCAHTNIELTPVVAEKPFITINYDGKYHLQVPQVKKESAGVEHIIDKNTTTIPFEKVYVARPNNTPESLEEGLHLDESFNTEIIQEKLDMGRHVVFTPGIYHLTKPLVVSHDNQVLLGLGLATLVSPKTKDPCIIVSPGKEGVRVAGLMLESSTEKNEDSLKPLQEDRKEQESLLLWGSKDTKDPGKNENPGVLSDIFIRVGGSESENSSCKTMIQLESGNVIGDNLWLWRADHTKLRHGEKPIKHHTIDGATEDYHLVRKGEYQTDHGIVVEGDNVTMYGLAAEHMTKDAVIWNGENGRTFFFQCELPYDVDQESFGNQGYTGYKVNEKVNTHELRGAGVYSFFRDFPCIVESAFLLPIEKENVKYQNIFTRYLNGFGGILYVLNKKGSSTGSLMSRIP
ncbi:MAG: hypothetical protein CMP11_08540 [Zetaproteobacteria bacterium]|nr:hypothetical protein [Pseudobdellovibrionaceae bacterium]